MPWNTLRSSPVRSPVRGNKKKMKKKRIGTVEIPQQGFLAVMKLD
jgi:translation elongation factor EF-4